MPTLAELEAVDAGPRPQPFERIAAASTTKTCQQRFVSYGSGQGKAGSNGHESGYHRAGAGFEMNCSCDGGCTSYCSMVLTGSQCEDDAGSNLTWADGWCHDMAQDLDSSNGVFGDGDLAGAQCGIGFGCAQKGCLFCFCGHSVSVSVVESGVSFGFSGAPDWTAKLQFGGTCPTCVRTTSGGGSDCIDPTGAGSTVSAGGARRITAAAEGPLEGCWIDTPIVLDLEGSGFRFTGIEDGVRFDLDADGAREQVAWTAPGSGHAFLAMDRDGNGRIDGGHELFAASPPRIRSGTSSGTGGTATTTASPSRRS